MVPNFSDSIRLLLEPKVVMRAEVTFTKKFWYENKYEITPNRNCRVVKENKGMVKDHHIKPPKSIMNRRCSTKKVVHKNFLIFTEKHLCWSLFFNKNAGYQSCSFIKKRLQHRCFLVDIAKLLRTAIFKNICELPLVSAFPFMLIWTFSHMNK